MAQSAGQSPQDMRNPKRGAVTLTLQTYFSLEVADFHPRNPQLRSFPELHWLPLLQPRGLPGTLSVLKLPHQKVSVCPLPFSVIDPRENIFRRRGLCCPRFSEGAGPFTLGS